MEFFNPKIVSDDVPIIKVNLDKLGTYGKCYDCEKESVDCCSLCERPICGEHQVAIIPDSRVFMIFGFCRGCAEKIFKIVDRMKGSAGV